MRVPTSARGRDGARAGMLAVRLIAPPPTRTARGATMSVATVRSRIEISGLSPRQIDDLRARLSYANPRYETARRLGHVPWGLEPRLSSLRVRDNIVEVPRGCTSAIRAVDPRVEWLDLRLRLPDVPYPAIEGLRDYQRAAVDAAVAGQQGYVVAPTGAGKTEIGCGIVSCVRQPALVLVPSLDLATQWRERIRSRLGIDAAMCVGGSIAKGEIMIATLQSLRDQARVSRVAHDAGLVIVDECHHVPATTFAGVIDSLPARWRIGLSATPERSDGLGVLIDHHLGRRLFAVAIADLAAAGHLVRPTYETVETSFRAVYRDAQDWARVQDTLVLDDERNALIARVVSERHDGSPALVLTGRVAHAEHLATRIAADGLRAVAIHGDQKKRERADILDRARRGEIDVLVGTTIADEGLDLPGLARLFLTFPSRAEARLLQRVGRIVRPAPNKRAPAVIDFVDRGVGVLAHQARCRARAFERAWRAQEAAA